MCSFCNYGTWRSTFKLGLGAGWNKIRGRRTEASVAVAPACSARGGRAGFRKIATREATMFIRNAWYVAAWADEIGATPLARRICNEPVVLFRDQQDRVA